MFPGGAARASAGPYGLGQRVPMLVVSPWSKGGWVCSEVFDHTSIIQFIERALRRAASRTSRRGGAPSCGDLTSAFDFQHPEQHASCPLPDTVGYMPPDHAAPPRLRADAAGQPRRCRRRSPACGRRGRCRTTCRAEARVERRPTTLDFANDGEVGATFHLTSHVARGRTVGLHASGDKQPHRCGLDPECRNGTTYDLSVHGPNGFLRQFKGQAAAGVEVLEAHDGRSGHCASGSATTATPSLH